MYWNIHACRAFIPHQCFSSPWNGMLSNRQPTRSEMSKTHPLFNFFPFLNQWMEGRLSIEDRLYFLLNRLKKPLHNYCWILTFGTLLSWTSEHLYYSENQQTKKNSWIRNSVIRQEFNFFKILVLCDKLMLINLY